MYTWNVSYPKEDNTCQVMSIDLGVVPIWWNASKGNDPSRLENGDIIVLKINGANHWSSRGETKYHGTYFQVLRILALRSWDNRPWFECEPVIDIPARKKE